MYQFVHDDIVYEVYKMRLKEWIAVWISELIENVGQNLIQINCLIIFLLASKQKWLPIVFSDREKWLVKDL